MLSTYYHGESKVQQSNFDQPALFHLCLLDGESRHPHKFWQKKTKIEDKFLKDFGDSISLIKKWFIEFYCGRELTCGAEHSAHQNEALYTHNNKNIRDMVWAVCRLKECKLS